MSAKGEGLADLMDDHPKDDWKQFTDSGVNFNTDSTFQPPPHRPPSSHPRSAKRVDQDLHRIAEVARHRPD